MGVFETLLVAGGEPVELEAHMARLQSSAMALFGEEPQAETHDLVLDCARGLELGRLRLDVAPGGGGALTAAVRVAEVDGALVFPPWERALTLAPVLVEGGVGAHKWSDRRLLDRAQQDCGKALPLIVDADGTALEVSRGNVFVVRGGTLVTPPCDGRILAGVARLRILDVAAEAGIELREETISVDDLAAADEVFASGSVRGVEPVRACEGVGEWTAGAVTPAVSAALRKRWLN